MAVGLIAVGYGLYEYGTGEGWAGWPKLAMLVGMTVLWGASIWLLDRSFKTGQ